MHVRTCNNMSHVITKVPSRPQLAHACVHQWESSQAPGK